MAPIDIANLSFEERLRLLDELWESLSRTPEAIPLTEAQREELDRRLNELDREGPVGIPWDEVLDRIRGRAACVPPKSRWEQWHRRGLP
jgi:putative addiction module component (TIGR02574 family)